VAVYKVFRCWFRQEQQFDLTQHRLLLDGQLTWRLSKARDIDIHAVLLDDVIVLLQRQDEKLILRSQGKEDRTTSTHSPIIPLSTMLTRSVANGKCCELTLNSLSYSITTVVFLVNFLTITIKIQSDVAPS
jgi:PH domain